MKSNIFDSLSLAIVLTMENDTYTLLRMITKFYSSYVVCYAERFATTDLASNLYVRGIFMCDLIRFIAQFEEH